MEVLITLVRLKRYNRPQLLQPHLSLVWCLQAQNMEVCEMGVLAHASSFGSDHFILNTNAIETFGILHARLSHTIVTLLKGRKTLPYWANLEP